MSHPTEEQPQPAFRLHRRFDRMARLVGEPAMARIHRAHVMVVGLGGVGSHAAEALLRSGVGTITLVDFDLVCVTNTNRQVQAMRGTIGKPKANVLAERLRLINPHATVRAVPLFYEARIADQLLGGRRRPDFVVDAIDNVTAKCHLLTTCRARNIPIVCCTGAAGRIDPTAVRVDDLADTRIDPLAQSVRKILRRKHDFPRKGAFGIPAVYSVEHLLPPQVLGYDKGEGFTCVCPGGENDRHDCEKRSVIWGTAGFVTGVFGMTAASVVIRSLTQEDIDALKGRDGE
ncbi:MAG: tRNA threonylcarbamoyladenosine dehydratase [Myxococcota bacterium]